MGKSNTFSDKTQPVVVDAQLNTDQRELQERVGFLQGITQRGRESKRAAAALDTLDARRTEATVNIALTNIAVSESLMRAGLVAAAVPRVGALAAQVNQSAAAVTSTLTKGFVAQMVMNANSTNQNHQLVSEGLTMGNYTASQAQAMMAAITQISDEDTARAHHRMEMAKDSLDALAEHATRGIEKTKDHLK